MKKAAKKRGKKKAVGVALSRADLLRWLDDGKRSIILSYREADGAMRDSQAIYDLCAVAALRRLVQEMPR